jgi:hypothetical protein
MRDKLIELIESARYWGANTSAEIADHLLAEGVIVPPCKVGQTVYCIRYDRARKPYVKPLGVLSITTYGKGVITLFTTRDDRLGSTAFLTREEAEKALERSENGTQTR